MHRTLWTGLSLLVLTATVSAGTIDTEFLERPWPKQRVREFEVGRYPVRWRQRASRTEGIFAGVRFEAPLDRDAAWKLAADYHDIGRMTPGVTAVRMLEDTPTRQVIQVDVKVFWKSLRLTFEVERDPPKAIRFRLVNEAVGEYRGLCVFEETRGGPDGPRTPIELATWFKPSRPIPTGLLLTVERMTLLRGVREFLNACEIHRRGGLLDRPRSV